MTTPQARGMAVDLTSGSDDDEPKAKSKSTKEPEQTEQEKAQADWQEELDNPGRVLERHEAQAKAATKETAKES